MRGHVGQLRMVVRFHEAVSHHTLLLAVLTHESLLDTMHSVSIIELSSLCYRGVVGSLARSAFVLLCPFLCVFFLTSAKAESGCFAARHSRRP